MNFQGKSLRNALNYLNDTASLVKQKLQAECVLIYVFDGKEKSFYLAARSGVNPRFEKIRLLKLGREIPPSVCSRKSPHLILDEKRLGFSNDFHGSLMAIPAYAHRKLCGLLLIYFSKRKFHSEEIANLNREIQLIGICLHTFNVLRSMNEEITGLKVVDDINRVVATELTPERLYHKLYEQVKRIVRVQNLRIDLFDVDKHCLRPVFFVHNGNHIHHHPVIDVSDSVVLSQIFRTHKVMLTSEYRSLSKRIDRKKLDSEMKVASFIALPLIVRDNFLGVIMCWDKKRKNIFSNQVVRLMKLMAGQSAIAIYNARLFEQLNKAINDLTLLYQIEYNISSILSIEELLKTAVHLIDSALGNLITTVLLPDDKSEKLVIKAMSPNVIVKSGFESVPMYRGIVGEAMKTKRAIYVADVEKEERYVSAIEGIKSELAIPLMAGTKILGVIDFQSRLPARFDLMTLDLLDDIAHRIATFLENAILYERIEKSYTETIRALVLAMEAKDSYTRGHSERVTELAMRLADTMGLTDGRKRRIYWAGLLHDIGKIAISESILNKPGQLDEFEFSEIKRHPVEGAKMLEPIQGLTEIVPVIRHHHENFDGSGYPDGLKAEQIPLESRILAVCDVYDAMTTIRSYRQPFSNEGALSAIKSFSGTRLDPEIVRVFVRMMQSK
ncbi:MAG: GAF and HD-GYP domain-containing protein [bacterium]